MGADVKRLNDEMRSVTSSMQQGLGKLEDAQAAGFQRITMLIHKMSLDETPDNEPRKKTSASHEGIRENDNDEETIDNIQHLNFCKPLVYHLSAVTLQSSKDLILPLMCLLRQWTLTFGGLLCGA